MKYLHSWSAENRKRSCLVIGKVSGHYRRFSLLNKSGETGAISDLLSLNNLVRERYICLTFLKVDDNTEAVLFLEEMSVFSGRSLIVAGVLCRSLMVWMIVVVVSSVFMSFSSLSSFDLDYV